MDKIIYKNKIELDVLETYANGNAYLLKITKTKLNKLDPEMGIVCTLKAFNGDQEYFTGNVFSVQEALDIMTENNKKKSKLKWVLFVPKKEL